MKAMKNMEYPADRPHWSKTARIGSHLKRKIAGTPQDTWMTIKRN